MTYYDKLQYVVYKFMHTYKFRGHPHFIHTLHRAKQLLHILRWLHRSRTNDDVTAQESDTCNHDVQICAETNLKSRPLKAGIVLYIIYYHLLPSVGGGWMVVIIEVVAKASKYITDLVWRFFVADMIFTDQLSVLAIIPTP